MGINPILRPQMEDIDGVYAGPLTPDEEYVLEKAEEETQQQEAIIEQEESQLDGVMHGVNSLEEVVAGQQNNLNNESEFIPNPENEEEAVNIITDQIASEQVVIENITGVLGFRSTLKESGTKQMYKALGIRSTPYSAREVHVESYNSNNRRIRALSLYKSHSEGVLDVLNKLGSSAWEGIKKLIRAVIDYVTLAIKNMFNSHVYKKGILDDKKFFETLTNTEFSIECELSLRNLYYQLETPLELVNNLEVSLDFLTRSVSVLNDMSIPDNEIADRCGLKEYISSLKPLKLYNVPQNSTAVKTSDPSMMSFAEGVIHLNGVEKNLEVRRLSNGTIPGSIGYKYWLSEPLDPAKHNLGMIRGERVKTYGIEICNAALNLIRLVNKVDYIRKGLMDLEKQLNTFSTEEVRARKFSVMTIVKYTYDVTSSVSRMGEVATSLRYRTEDVLKGK